MLLPQVFTECLLRLPVSMLKLEGQKKGQHLDQIDW